MDAHTIIARLRERAATQDAAGGWSLDRAAADMLERLAPPAPCAVTEPKIVAYYADVQYVDGAQTMFWVTIAERVRLVGSKRVASAIYKPAIVADPQQAAVAWLVTTGSNEFITTNIEAMQQYADMGCTAYRLAFAT